MQAIYVTPKPHTYWTSGFGLFNKTKPRKKQRNTVQQSHIEQNRKAGPHKDRKKEANRQKCRGKIKEDIF